MVISLSIMHSAITAHAFRRRVCITSMTHDINRSIKKFYRALINSGENINNMATGVTPKKVRKLVDTTSANEDECREVVTETLSTLQEIDKYQNEIEILCNQANKEMIDIERKYSKLKRVHFEKRNALINKIPHFWVTAVSFNFSLFYFLTKLFCLTRYQFVNHPDLSAMLDETEEDCLHYLTKLEVQEAEDITSGYRIDFHFDENPYFENTVLSKEFHLGAPGKFKNQKRTLSKSEILDFPTSQSTSIKWKEGFNLSQNIELNSSKRGKKQYSEQKSFFTWFNDHVDPISDDIAEVIKDDLWVNPLNYYLVPDIEVENEEEENSDCEDNEECELSETQNELAEAQQEGDEDV